MMDNKPSEKDFALLAGDRYTFAVLDRILRRECEWILTDHESLILCRSEAPYPVWIWTPDGCGEAVKERAWRLAAARRPAAGEYRINLKYELAEYVLTRAARAQCRAETVMGLYAYDCPAPVQPAYPADGDVHCCTEQDTEEAAAILPLFYTEIGEAPPPRERCLEKARDYIAARTFFFWRNGAGETVACCSYKANQGLACLGSVFTLPAYRRKHYAQHLVYRVTKKALENGLTPMLYTDAGYPASNACYEKIGYVLRGRLCTLAVRNGKA